MPGTGQTNLGLTQLAAPCQALHGKTNRNETPNNSISRTVSKKISHEFHELTRIFILPFVLIREIRGKNLFDSGWSRVGKYNAHG